MLVLASNVAGHDQLQILFTTLAWPQQRATPENRWGELILPYLPKALLPDAGALAALFAGHSSLYAEGHWRAWIGPLALWLVAVLVLAGTMLCLMSLLRKQWDNERLSYPLAEVPLAATQPGGGLFRRPLFWLGFGFAAGLQILSLASTFWPTVPVTNLGVRYYPLFQAWPWRAAGSFPICYYPFAFGLSFLLPLDLSFSCWLFFLLSRFESIGAAAMGFTAAANDFPYTRQQATGAFLAFSLCVLWAARGHLALAWRSALRGDAREEREPLSYRTALAGSLVGLLLLWLLLVGAGMRPHVGAAYLFLLFLIILAFARIRAEAGLPSLDLGGVGPDEMLARGIGGGALAPREMGVLSLLFFLTRTHRQFPMQNYADSLRLGDRAALDQRRLILALAAATGFGAVCAFWALLHVTYQSGLGSARFTGPAGWAFGDSPWQRMAGWMSTPAAPKPGEKWAYLFGGGLTWGLFLMRARYLWWPLHPIGYVIANNISLQRLWVPVMVSWLLKLLLLRYGGLRAYRAALPFFLGLVLGQFAAGFLRTLLDLAFGLYLPANSGIGGL